MVLDDFAEVLRTKDEEPLGVTLPETVKDGPWAIYIELRDELWHALAQKNRLGDDLENTIRLAQSLSLLHLANTIVGVLLNAQPEDTKRALEFFSWEGCNRFIEQTAREIQAKSHSALTVDSPSIPSN